MELDYVKLKEIKPFLSGYIRESLAMLKMNALPDEKTVHDVRVLMKKSRAALKLASSQLEKESVDRDISSLKAVGQLMCSWRDTSVHRKSLKELRKEYPGIFSRLKENEKLSALLSKEVPGEEPSEELMTSIDEIEILLNKTGYRIRFQSMVKIDPAILIKDLENTYGNVVDIYLKCRNNLHPSDIHEFRKRSKDFLYQLYFFRPLNTSVIKSLEKKLDNMTQSLGKYNDLAQLVKALEYKYPANRSDFALDELVVKIREKQDRYLSKVWPVAYKIFCPGQKLVNILGFKLLVI